MPKKANYNVNLIEIAINDIRAGRSIRGTAKKYGIPKSTLEFRLKNPGHKDTCGPSSILSGRAEKILSNCAICNLEILTHLLLCSNCKNKFHMQCIPKTHKQHIPDEEDEDLFLCNKCFKEEPEEDDDTEDIDDLIKQYEEYYKDF